MPIYEYRCSACRHEARGDSEIRRRAARHVPACGKDALTKLVSAAGFHLKGSGWYQTDFKSSGAKPTAKTDEGKADAAKPEAGKDAAPADGAKAPESKPAAPVTPAAAPAAHRRQAPDSRTPSNFASMKRYLIAGLLVWVPLGITIWVLVFLVTTLDQTLLLIPEGARPDALLGFHVPGFGVLLSFRAPAADRRGRCEFLRRPPDRVLGEHAGPHSGRQVDLLVGEAGQRHAAAPIRATRSARRCSSNFRTKAAGRSRS
mgnify:CR=1 FL=1